MSSKNHGKLEQDINLEPYKGKTPTKDCPGCSKPLLLSAKVCEYCGFEYEDDEKDEEDESRRKYKDFPKLTMKELTLVDRSCYRWETLEGHEEAYGAIHYRTVYILKVRNKNYALFFQEYSVRYPNQEPICLIHQGTKKSCFNKAEKLLDVYNKGGLNCKDNMWSSMPSTRAQEGVLKSLLKKNPKVPCSKYKASLNIGLLCAMKTLRSLLRAN